MPSIIPGYVYSLFATVIIGAILIATCGLATTNVKAEAETQQLHDVVDYVATKSLELLSNPSEDNSSATATLSLPISIGNQQYWIQVYNDSSGAWVQAGLGVDVVSSEQRMCIPADVAASGVYVSDFGWPYLQYQSNNTGQYLTLCGGN